MGGGLRGAEVDRRSVSVPSKELNVQAEDTSAALCLLSSAVRCVGPALPNSTLSRFVWRRGVMCRAEASCAVLSFKVCLRRSRVQAKDKDKDRAVAGRDKRHTEVMGPFR